MKRRNLVMIAPAAATASVGAGWFTPAAAQLGVVKFGQSASLTGGQAQYGADVRSGIQAAFAAMARDGTGPRCELASIDDGGHKEKCQENVKTLLDAGVVSLIGLTSGAAAESVLLAVEQAQVAMLGTASGNMGIRDPKLTMPYHVRAGYDIEYKAMVRYLKDFGMTRVGYVHLVDTSPANEAAMTAALDAVGIKMTLSVPLDRNAKSYDAQADSLLAEKLHCVLFTTNAAPILGVVDRMLAGHYTGFFFSSSFAGQSLFDEMAKRQQVVIMSQVVPRPNAVALPLIKRYIADLAALDGAQKPGYTSLEGYITGLVAVEAVRATRGGPVTRQRFRESLSNLSLNLGGYAVNFGTRKMTGSGFVDVVAIDRSGRLMG